MSDVPQEASSTEEQQSRSRKERSRTPSPAPPLFTFNSTPSRTTWHRSVTDDQIYIQLVVEREGFPNGAVIADRINPHLLFKLAPALQKRLEGRRIFVPSASCLDEETIESMIFGIVRCAKEGIPMPEPVEKKPVSMIKIHCVLVFLEMVKEAHALKDKLWDSFQQVRLTPMDVLWIWDTFGGRVQSEPYTAPFAHEYVQMMAWQILNLDAMGMLDQNIRHLIELEKEPKYFTETMEARFKTHGLDRFPIARKAMKEEHVAPKKVSLGSTSNAAKNTLDGQKNESETTIAEQPCQPAASKFNFASASTPIVADPEAPSQSLSQQGTTRSNSAMGNTGSQRQTKTAPNAPKPAAIHTAFSFGFGGVSAPKPTVQNATTTLPPTPSGIGANALTQRSFTGLGQTPFGTSTPGTTQPTTTTNPVGFVWGGNGAVQSSINASSPKATDLFGSAGVHLIPFGNPSKNPPQRTTSLFPGSITFKGLGTVTTPRSETRHPPLGNSFSNAGSTPFGAPSSNAPFAGGFGAQPGISSNSPGMYGVPSSNFAPSTVAPQVPHSAGFPMNGNFGGQSQQQNRSPSGDPFSATADTTSAGNSMFSFQSAPGRDGDGARNGAAGGGMVRKIMKPTGTRRFKR